MQFGYVSTTQTAFENALNNTCMKKFGTDKIKKQLQTLTFNAKRQLIKEKTAWNAQNI